MGEGTAATRLPLTESGDCAECVAEHRMDTPRPATPHPRPAANKGFSGPKCQQCLGWATRPLRGTCVLVCEPCEGKGSALCIFLAPEGGFKEGGGQWSDGIALIAACEGKDHNSVRVGRLPFLAGLC